jgi:hypothetical protein
MAKKYISKYCPWVEVEVTETALVKKRKCFLCDGTGKEFWTTDDSEDNTCSDCCCEKCTRFKDECECKISSTLDVVTTTVNKDDSPTAVIETHLARIETSMACLKTAVNTMIANETKRRQPVPKEPIELEIAKKQKIQKAKSDCSETKESCCSDDPRDPLCRACYGTKMRNSISSCSKCCCHKCKNFKDECLCARCQKCNYLLNENVCFMCKYGILV